MKYKKTLLVLIVAVLLLPSFCMAVPFWGAKQSSPAGTAPGDLKPGQYVWTPEIEPAGPVVLVVSLTEQRCYVYRDGVQIGVSTVSTGKKGHRTPTGIFTILQKDRHHRSKKYHNAPMPFTERLTWSGICLHAGGLPGYPSSHGCIHLPTQFARKLFGITHDGLTVVVANEVSSIRDVVHPPTLVPVDVTTGMPVQNDDLAQGEEYHWHPQTAPEGPLSVVVSAADKEAIAYRNGVEIGRARLTIKDPGKPLGTHAFIVKESKDDNAKLTWMAISLPGYAKESQGQQDESALERIMLPKGFISLLHQALRPGVTMVVTDAPVMEHNSGVPLTVVTNKFGQEG